MTVAEEAVTPAAAPAAAPRRIRYEPGLDGLRAVALLSIFVVHADVGLAPGGFLAVSTFFTLSGFLITALLVSEHRANGKVALGSFWQRRARRLLPASLIAIFLIAAATIWFGDATQNRNLFGDEVGALAYVANWRFLLAGTTYAGEFAGQSPLLHFWSLAIEEQFYLVFPLIAVGALVWSRRWPWALPAVLAAGIAGSLLAGIVASSSDGAPDRLYFRTDIRAGELLVGALFGYWWVNHGHRLTPAMRTGIKWVGVGLLVLMVGLIATSDYHDVFWYRGGLLAYSLVTVGVVLAAVESGGPVNRALSWKPLVLVGVISYGAYLVHWPLFLWLSTDSGLSGGARLLVGTVVALAVAYLSYRLVELPIREKRSYKLPLLVGAAVALVVGALWLGSIAPEAKRDKAVPLEETEEEITDFITYTKAAPGEAPTIGIYGDSTALVSTLGMAKFDDTDASIRMGGGWAGLGCTPIAPATFISDGAEVESNEICGEWRDQWTTAADEGEFDLSFVQFGPWEVKEVRPDGSEAFSTISEDPAHDALVEQRIAEGLDILTARSPLVVVATSPYVEPGRVNGNSPSDPQPDADPARMDRLNEIIVDVASRYPNVAVLDLAGWVEAQGDDDARLRPDGVHFTDQVALELSPQLAATLNSIIEVSEGGEPPTDDAELFPVLRYPQG